MKMPGADDLIPKEVYYQIYFIWDNTKFYSSASNYSPLTDSSQTKTRGFIREASTALSVAQSLPRELSPRIKRTEYFGTNQATRTEDFSILQLEAEIRIYERV